MMTVTLGKTNITVDKNGFGTLPMQRVERKASIAILRKAYESGIAFYDTARAYSDSEEKLGLAFANVRHNLILATKTTAQSVADFWADLETSLRLLKTDYIDIYQLHNPAFCPKPDDQSGLYDAALKAKEQGKIRFIGISNHRVTIAEEAVRSGLYDTLQFPFSYLAAESEKALVSLCEKEGIGFLAMKALSGGLIVNARAAYAYLARFADVLPIWGIQRESELDEFIGFAKESPQFSDAIQAQINTDRQQLAGSFCRGCGYCLPCPAEIEIITCARMSLLLKRFPSERFLGEEWQAKMRRIDNCQSCGKCAKRCPYELDTPSLLKANLKDYEEALAGNSCG